MVSRPGKNHKPAEQSRWHFRFYNSMPVAAKRPCSQPGCGALTDAGRCPAHKQQQEQLRGSSTQRGYGYRWQVASKAFLRAHPLCQCPDCDEGRKHVTVATVVDHRIPARGDMKLFWDKHNWQSMSKPCHDSKTASEDGGFGHSK